MSKTSQTRQPQLFVYCQPRAVFFVVFQFITRMPFYKERSILCLTATMATMPLLPTESYTSLASKTLSIFCAQRPLVRPVFLTLGRVASTDTLFTLLFHAFYFSYYYSCSSNNPWCSEFIGPSKLLVQVDTLSFRKDPDPTGGTQPSPALPCIFYIG